MSSTEITTPSSPLEKFAIFLTKEPYKSFRKTNITNGDDMLTTQGANMFLNWILRTKFADEFNKEVVQPMLKEQEKK